MLVLCFALNNATTKISDAFFFFFGDVFVLFALFAPIAFYVELADAGLYSGLSLVGAV